MAKKTKPTFEDSTARLSEIVEELESDEVTLKSSLDLYKEGIDLLEYCINELRQADVTIQELHKRNDEVFELLDLNE
jgi:exodeoxyribonuclease VII small subunit